MDDEKPRPRKQCRCGSGDYCRMHREYGLPQLEVSHRQHHDPEPESTVTQRCGGGHRVLRKSIEHS